MEERWIEWSGNVKPMIEHKCKREDNYEVMVEMVTEEGTVVAMPTKIMVMIEDKETGIAVMIEIIRKIAIRLRDMLGTRTTLLVPRTFDKTKINSRDLKTQEISMVGGTAIIMVMVLHRIVIIMVVGCRYYKIARIALSLKKKWILKIGSDLVTTGTRKEHLKHLTHRVTLTWRILTIRLKHHRAILTAR